MLSGELCMDRFCLFVELPLGWSVYKGGTKPAAVQKVWGTKCLTIGETYPIWLTCIWNSCKKAMSGK